MVGDCRLLRFPVLGIVVIRLGSVGAAGVIPGRGMLAALLAGGTSPGKRSAAFPLGIGTLARSAVMLGMEPMLGIAGAALISVPIGGSGTSSGCVPGIRMGLMVSLPPVSFTGVSANFGLSPLAELSLPVGGTAGAAARTGDDVVLYTA